MELIFNPCGEFRWNPEGPVSQIHSPHLLVGAPGFFSDLLRFAQMLKREWGAESNGKLPHLFIPRVLVITTPDHHVHSMYSYRHRFWHLSLIIWPSQWATVLTVDSQPHWPCWSKKRKHNFQKKASSRNVIRSITFMNYVMKEYSLLI